MCVCVCVFGRVLFKMLMNLYFRFQMRRYHQFFLNKFSVTLTVGKFYFLAYRTNSTQLSQL